MIWVTKSERSFPSQSDVDLGDDGTDRLLSEEAIDEPINPSALYRTEQKPCSSCVIPLSKRLIALGAVAGSVVLRMANYYLWTNATACYMAGFAGMYAISCAAPPPIAARIRQVALPLLGQTSIFALSQAWANDTKRKDQIDIDDTIISLLGANMQIILNWAWDQWGIRSQSDLPSAIQAERAPNQKIRESAQPIRSPGCCSQNFIHSLNFLTSLGCIIGANLARDEVLKGIISFFGSFFVSQVIGERVIDYLDNHIEKKTACCTSRCTFRGWKTALLTIAYLGQVASFTPWYDPGTSQRLGQLVYTGIALGFFDGINDRSENRKIERIPIEHLQELEKLPVPERGKCCCNNCQSCQQNCKWAAHRTWKLAVPLIALGGMLYFICREYLDGLEEIPAIALGAMFGGFVGGTVFCHLVDETWDKKQRHTFRDFFMTKIWFSQRILGIDPLFLYFVMTNSVKMDADALKTDHSPLYLPGIFIGWFSYGLKTSFELFIGASDRVGNPQRKYPKMAVINGVMTLVLYLMRKN
jgi:hypothetical protein